MCNTINQITYELAEAMKKPRLISIVQRLVNLNAEKKRMWFEDLKDIYDGKMIDSLPISLNFINEKL